MQTGWYSAEDRRKIGIKTVNWRQVTCPLGRDTTTCRMGLNKNSTIPFARKISDRVNLTLGHLDGIV